MSEPDPDDLRDDALWRLLGRARVVEPSPYFVRRVLRAVESGEAPRSGWWAVFLRAVAPVAACALLAAFAVAGVWDPSPGSLGANADIEFETIQNLDLLVSNYESSIWLDPSASSYSY